MRVWMMPALVMLLPLGCSNPSGSSSTGSSSGGSTSSSSGGGGTVRPAVCTPLCVAAGDCATAGVVLLDEDNWSCDQGGCRYLGCQQDAECPPGPDAGWRCAPAVGGLRTCRQACTTPADCPSQGGGLHGWRCDNGSCVETGCQQDVDCAVIGDVHDAGYSCRTRRTPLGQPVMACVPRCTTASQCPGATPDQMTCEDGTCLFVGCRNDAQCVNAETDGGLVCR